MTGMRWGRVARRAWQGTESSELSLPSPSGLCVPLKDTYSGKFVDVCMLPLNECPPATVSAHIVLGTMFKLVRIFTHSGA
jgi:hypothetical protein